MSDAVSRPEEIRATLKTRIYEQRKEDTMVAIGMEATAAHLYGNDLRDLAWSCQTTGGAYVLHRLLSRRGVGQERRFDSIII